MDFFETAQTFADERGFTAIFSLIFVNLALGIAVAFRDGTFNWNYLNDIWKKWAGAILAFTAVSVTNFDGLGAIILPMISVGLSFDAYTKLAMFFPMLPVPASMARPEVSLGSGQSYVEMNQQLTDMRTAMETLAAQQAATKPAARSRTKT